MIWLFATTLFLSAALLFSVQPMVAKMLLPLMGGTPAVWNTCLVFFQAALLGGYAYAHLLTTKCGPRWQARVHVSLLLLAAALLPIRVSERAIAALSAGAPPALWLLVTLSVMVGLPFFVASATGPLLQRWFSHGTHAGASDPYFLYAASNAGSLVALLAYPVILEPTLRLAQQTWFWGGGFGLLIVLSAACGMALSDPSRRMSNPPASPSPAPGTQGQGSPAHSAAGGRILWSRRLHWTMLALAPSSLMMGVTTFISTDIAAMPLLWVIPLSIYLATFILAFARRRLLPAWWLDRALPIGALTLTFVLLSKATQPVGLLLILHLAFFFLAALFCHTRLADGRPSAAQLTEFYFWTSTGGVLGGLFNALVAPSLFSTVLEYPLGVLFVCFLRASRTARDIPAEAGSTRSSTDFPPLPAVLAKPALVESGRSAWRSARDWRLGFWPMGPLAQFLPDLLIPLALGLMTAVAVFCVAQFPSLPIQAKSALVFGVPIVTGFLAARTPLRFALALGAIMLASACYPNPHGRTLYVERDFFGVSRVTLDPTRPFRRIVHGNTLHGRQFLDPSRQCEPLAYYHRLGPAGQIFQEFGARSTAPEVAVVGLGAGALVCYSKAGERWTVYEIDPAVVRIASNPNYFSYLSRCAAAPVGVVMGDARLRLREAPDRRYGLLILDAFSSDAIPVHLMTREALQLYLAKLAPGGFLAFHISNRSLDLQPVLGDLAADLGLTCLAWDDTAEGPVETQMGKEASHWVVLAPATIRLPWLEGDKRWERIQPRRQPSVWTDDFSNLLSAFRW